MSKSDRAWTVALIVILAVDLAYSLYRILTWPRVLLPMGDVDKDRGEDASGETAER